MARCIANTARNTPCKAHAMKGRKMCLFHTRKGQAMRGAKRTFNAATKYDVGVRMARGVYRRYRKRRG